MERNDPSPPAASESEPKKPTRRNDGPWWLYPVVLILAIAIVVLLAEKTGVHPESTAGSLVAWTPSPQPQGETVSLTIDFGNGAKREFAALPWREGATVGDLMESARNFHPGIAYSQQGAGETAFLEALEGVKNGGANRKNWLYQVNGEHAHESFAIRQLNSGDKVLWIYASGKPE